MKYCWRINDEQSSILLPAVVLFSVMCLSDYFKHAAYAVDPIKYSIMGLSLYFLVSLLPWLIVILNFRKYQIDKSGMTVYYPFGVKKYYPWNLFQDIALCKVHYASASNQHTLAIRCVLIKEKNGPRNAIVAKGWWSKKEYEVFHFGKIITIYYTEERYEEFLSKCPIFIGDYRFLEDRP